MLSAALAHCVILCSTVSPVWSLHCSRPAQHPFELKEKLATVPILKLCLSGCHVFVGRRFAPGSCAELDNLIIPHCSCYGENAGARTSAETEAKELSGKFLDIPSPGRANGARVVAQAEGTPGDLPEAEGTPGDLPEAEGTPGGLRGAGLEHKWKASAHDLPAERSSSERQGTSSGTSLEHKSHEPSRVARGLQAEASASGQERQCRAGCPITADRSTLGQSETGFEAPPRKPSSSGHSEKGFVAPPKQPSTLGCCKEGVCCCGHVRLVLYPSKDAVDLAQWCLAPAAANSAGCFSLPAVVSTSVCQGRSKSSYGQDQEQELGQMNAPMGTHGCESGAHSSASGSCALPPVVNTSLRKGAHFSDEQEREPEQQAHSLRNDCRGGRAEQPGSQGHPLGNNFGEGFAVALSDPPHREPELPGLQGGPLRRDCGEGYAVTLVVFDGTWKLAGEMARANLSYLGKYCKPVCLAFDRSTKGPEAGACGLIMKNEPSQGLVSTAEAVARALSFLEPSEAPADAVLKCLGHVVGAQMQHHPNALKVQQS